MDEQEMERLYDVIPIVSKMTEVAGPERSHNHFDATRLTGRLSFELAALQPLHIGTGLLVPPETIGLGSNYPLVKPFFRAGDQLTLPGSSLKGAFRSLVELFTFSCVCKTHPKARETWGEGQALYSECVYDPEHGQHQLCPACRLFGALGWQGQVRFDDAPQVGGGRELVLIPPQYEPKLDPDYRRYYPYEQKLDPEKNQWPLEVATVGSRFAVQAQFTNLKPSELGVLLVAMGQGEWQLCPRIGAGKSSGLGGTRVENLLVERWMAKKSCTTFDGDVWTAVDVDKCINQASARLLFRSDEGSPAQLQQVLRIAPTE